jgi:hypothetical protein
MATRSESRKKTKLVQVRCTPDEKATLKSRASDFGVSVGELCRRAIFGSVPKSVSDKNAVIELAESRADLGRLGGLLKGWLAGSFNQPPPDPQHRGEIIPLLRKIEAAQQQVVVVAKKVAGKQ